MDDVSVGYVPGKPVLQKINLRLDPDERVALLGANGNGKSTMAKLLAGRLQPMSGEIRQSRKLKVGYFAQHQTEELDLQATPLLAMERAAPRLTPEKCRAHIAQFGLDAERAKTPTGSLSGGEKARLLLALMSHGAPNILLLDEPTNHLDIDSRQALVQAINDFPGAVVLISHDPHLIELTVDRFWLVKDGHCRQFDGDLADYRDLVLNGGRNSANRERRNGSGNRKPVRPMAGPTLETVDLRRQVEQSAVAVSKLTQALRIIEQKLADRSLYDGDAGTITDWQRKHADVAQRLAEAEETWLKAQMALEEAGA
jgi:ATP-binding cassette subfamily F protein 3